MPKIISRYTRLRSIYLFYIIFFLFLIIRLTYVQVFQYNRLSEIASRQHNVVIKIDPVRGAIYDANLKPFAFSINLESIYANPRMVKDPVSAASMLSDVLGIEKHVLVGKFTQDKAFVWLKRKVSSKEAEKVRALGLRFIGFIKEPKRFYPNERMACHVVGFAGIDNIGLEGIEMALDGYLCGKPGWYYTKQDAKQRKLPSYKNKYVPPVNGYDVVLTLDMVLQSFAEAQLDIIMNKFHSKAATIIMIEPATGRILALANRPNFAPNDFQKADALSRKNRAVTDIFEPGSVFKIVTASGALEEEKVSMSDEFFCENGEYRPIPSYTLHDYHPYGWLVFRKVIENSSNIGTGKIAQRLGPQNLYKYIKLYGFGQNTGVDLPGEVPGMINPPSKWSKTSPWNIPMGQEIAVTSIQTAAAMAAIANNGVLMKPYVIDRIQDKKGNVIKSFSPVEVRRVLSDKTAKQIQEILAGVVENGTGKSAKIQGYRAAGKTGTAQKVEGGRYSQDKYVGSFVGFAPAHEAMVACMVSVDEPHPVHFGAVVAAPGFSKVVSQAIEYLNARKVFMPKQPAGDQ